MKMKIINIKNKPCKQNNNISVAKINIRVQMKVIETNLHIEKTNINIKLSKIVLIFKYYQKIFLF